MKHSVLPSLIFVLMAGFCGPAAASTTFFSDLGQSTNGALQNAKYQTSGSVNASDFITGASATIITDATLSFSNWDDTTHILTPKIYTDNAGVPGTLVGTLSTISITADIAGPGTGTFRNYNVTSAGISLAANTKYWLGVSINSAAGTAPVLWNTTTSTTMDSGSTFAQVTTTALKTSTNGGSSWSTGNSVNGVFSLSGNLAAAPEPTRVLLLGIGWGFFLLRRRRR